MTVIDLDKEHMRRLANQGISLFKEYSASIDEMAKIQLHLCSRQIKILQAYFSNNVKFVKEAEELGRIFKELEHLLKTMESKNNDPPAA